jgi:hypothetical protein
MRHHVDALVLNPARLPTESPGKSRCIGGHCGRGERVTKHQLHTTFAAAPGNLPGAAAVSELFHNSIPVVQHLRT